MHGGFACFGNFIGHAAAQIENHADGNGNVFGRKGDHFLFGAVFEDAEIIRLETGDEPIVRISDGDIHQRDVDVGV